MSERTISFPTGEKQNYRNFPPRRENLINEKEILDCLPAPCFICKRDGEIAYSNNRYQEVFGPSKRQVLTGDYLDNFVPGATPQRRREEHFSSGRLQIFEWTDQPRFSENGELRYIVSLAIDITEKEKLRRISTIDEQTGLYNRAYLESELKTFDYRGIHDYSMIFCDINDLKAVNDEKGHSVGDKLIQNAAQVLKDMCRSCDIVARIGGDEFVVVLPNTQLEIAASIKKRILQAAKQRDVSLAVGIAQRQKNESCHDLCKRADKAMYRNKQQQKLKKTT